METNNYDSTQDTKAHIQRVQDLLNMCRLELNKRSFLHDKSKLESPEKEHFDRETPILKDLVYQSKEYTECTRRLKPALDHHYANNSHHPQHYPNGINDMDLFDIMEMLVDWKASSERGKDGDIRKSIEYGSTRFNINPQLSEILMNTVNRYKFLQ